MKQRPIFTTLPKEKTAEKPKRRFKLLPMVWAGFKRMLMVLGGLVLLSSMISLFALSQLAMPQTIDVPNEFILSLDLDDAFYEVQPAANFTSPLVAPRPLLREVIAAIDAAVDDDHVKGIYATMGDGQFALAHIQEFRAAMARFKQSGKFTVIYSDSYGGMGSGIGRYYLASVFDEIWMQPLGVLGIAGINIEMPFARKALDALGVTPQFFQRKDYKSAYESLTNSEISPENREMMSALANDIAQDLLQDISADREISPTALKDQVNKGLLLPEEALGAKLIDYVAYEDQVEESLNQRMQVSADDGGASWMDVATYNAVRAQSRSKIKIAARKKQTVALIYAVGAIMPSGAQASVLGPGSAIAAADEIAPAILDAAEDDSISAIVLRVDSPGGSPVASETILRALQIAQEKGKKVIVSMGSVAASGGYWIAASADQIFVSPLTITGSIGVIGGKFSLGGLWDKLDINWDAVSWGDNAAMWSPNSEFSDGEAERINALMDHIYDGFIARVSAGRNMSPKDVDDVAGGRVWSGKAALDKGLADQEGGLKEALHYTAQLVLEDENAVANDMNIILMPKPKTPIEQLIELLGGQVTMGQKISAMLAQFNLMTDNNVMAYETLRIQ